MKNEGFKGNIVKETDEGVSLQSMISTNVLNDSQQIKVKCSFLFDYNNYLFLEQILESDGFRKLLEDLFTRDDFISFSNHTLGSEFLSIFFEVNKIAFEFHLKADNGYTYKYGWVVTLSGDKINSAEMYNIGGIKDSKECSCTNREWEKFLSEYEKLPPWRES